MGKDFATDPSDTAAMEAAVKDWAERQRSEVEAFAKRLGLSAD